MCQIENKKMNKRSIICYRIYATAFKKQMTVSYYNSHRLTAIGKKIKCQTGPFHAFPSMKALKQWNMLQNGGNINKRRNGLRIYKCKLSGNLTSGIWSCSIPKIKVHTITGENLTVLKKLNLKDIWPDYDVNATL